MTRPAGQLLTLVLAVALWRGGAALDTNSTTTNSTSTTNNATAELVIVPENTTAREGNTLLLTCVGYGVPTPEVVWLKEGEELTNTSRISIFVEEIVVQGVLFVQTTLQICSVNITEDPGIYSCQATNYNGTDTQSFQIGVEPRENIEIVIQPDDGEFSEGYTIILSCVALGSPGLPNITWSRGRETITPTSDRNVRIYQEVLEAGGMEFVLSNLEICGISPEDAGLYSCSAALQSGLYASSDDFWVNVTTAGPEIVIAPADSRVREGETVLLTCVAFDAPSLPEVLWTYGGYPLSDETNNRTTVYSEVVEENGMEFVVTTLQICSVALGDAGKYSCVARETDGERNATVYFYISVMEDSPPDIVIAPQNTTVTVGNTALFSCVALATSSQIPTVFWVRGDGISLSNDSRISVYNTPVVEGGAQFVHSILEICSVDIRDENFYTCVANTSSGYDSASFLLRVDDEGPPNIVIAPSDTDLLQGNTALFTCVAAYGIAPASIEWFRNGERIYNNSRLTSYTNELEERGVRFVQSILELCSAEDMDEGYYSCVAYITGDPSRNTSVDFRVGVIEPEEEVQIVIAPSDSVVTENSTVLLTCVVYGLPLPSTITWTRNNYTIYNSTDVTIYFEEIDVNRAVFLQSVLEVCGVSEEEEGNYTCSAESSAGEDSESFELIVQPFEPPEILIAPADASVTEGDTILLTCVARGSPLPSLSWYRSGTGTNIGIGTEDYRFSVYGENQTVNGLEFVTSVLEICSVEFDDEGEYGCRADSDSGYQSVQFNVTVEEQLEPATIVIAPSNTSVDINNTVLVTCVAYGNPPAEISWYMGSTPLSNYADTVLIFSNQLIENGVIFTQSILQLCGVGVENEALYTCVASNYVNSTQSSFYLNVLEPPIIVIQPSDTSAPYGSTVLLTCVATSKENEQLVSISWERNSEPVTNLTNYSTSARVYKEVIEEGGVVFTTSVLELCDVSFDEEGEYSCVASDDVGTTSANFTLSVYTDVNIVIISDNTTVYDGATALFTCVATGTPDPTLTWQRYGYAVNETDRITVTQATEVIEGVTFVTSILQICDIDYEMDGGEYECVAEVPREYEMASFYLTIQTQAPIFTIPPENLTIVNGTEVTLTCQVEGSPLPSITWERDGVPLPPDYFIAIDVKTANSTVYLGPVTESAVYSCLADNGVGTNRANATITVQYPLVVSDSPANLTVLLGEIADFDCSFSGSPPPTDIRWFGNGDVLNSTRYTITPSDDSLSSRLSFNVSLADHNSQYFCEAFQTLVTGDVVSAVSDVATLTVNYPLVVSESPANLTVLLGEIADFDCSFSGSPPPSDIRWFGNGDVLNSTRYTITPSDDSLSSRLSFNVSLADHNSQYFCEAFQTLVTGDVVSAVSDVATLTVNSPPVLSQNNSLPAVLNGTLILTFTISDALPPVMENGVIWTFQSRSAGPDSIPVVINSNTTERYQFTFTPEMVRLRVHPVMMEDEGNYTVNVSNTVGSDSYTLSVEVVVGAYITDPPNDTTVHVGLNATFRCVATSDPPHRVLWLFAGSALENGDKYVITDISEAVSELVVVNVSATDDGEYTCDVDNGHGNDTDIATLTVISTPVVTAVTPSPYIVLPDQTAVLTFRVDNDIPPVSLMSSDWSATNDEGPHTIAFEDPRFTFSEDFTSLTIDPVHPYDEGTYTLTATNDAGTGNASIFLDVQSVPSITSPPNNSYTDVGDDAVFRCIASGEPRPTIEWMFRGEVLSSGDMYNITLTPDDMAVVSELVVLSVGQDEEGYYSCVATNVHDNISVSAFLQPLEAPVVTPATLGTLTGLLEEPLAISFNISDAAPDVNENDITWYLFPDPTITEGSGSASGDGLLDDFELYLKENITIQDNLSFSDGMATLCIPRLQYSDEGVYFIGVQNRAGTDSAQTRVDVQAVPQINITLSMSRAREGEMVTIVCEVIAEPDAEVYFRLRSTLEDAPEVIISVDDRHTLSSSHGSEYYITDHVLVISDLIREDIGMYVCVASNDLGNGTSEAVLLEVLVLPDIIPAMELYQFIANVSVSVSVSFIRTKLEYPPLEPGNVSMWFRNMDGNVSEVMTTEYRQLSEDRLTLTLVSVRPEDNGTYWIVAENDAGMITSPNATVEVFINPTIEGGDDEIVVMEGVLVTFTCNATGNPSPSFTWTKNGEFLVTSIGKFEASEYLTSELDNEGRCPDDVCAASASLTITSVTVGDTGLYACRASIGVDIPAAEDVIIETPYNLTVTMIVIDYCPDGEDPCGEFGECEDVGDGFLCACLDNYNGDLCDNRVEVFSPPVFVEEPLSIAVNIFGAIRFTCRATGNPQPTIAWQQNGQPLKDRVRPELVITDIELEDRGMYRCIATNSEGSITSTVVILSINRIAQYLLIIQIQVVVEVGGRKKRQNDNDVQMLVAMLNEQLVGTKIGDATVYSVAIQEGFDLSSSNGDVPLIFTFYGEEDETGDGEPTDPPEPDEVVEVTFDVAEIERVVEEDVMLVAMDLGLNVTVMEFERFDGCPSNVTTYSDILLSWEESAIGDLASASCPCEAADLNRFATRVCGGSFITGGDWNTPVSDVCIFDNITNQLCLSPELTAIEDLVSDATALDRLSVAVVTQLLENMVNSSSGNATESDSIFSVIDSILEVNVTELVLGQGEFNTSGRLLSFLEIVIDAYPAPGLTQLMQNSFRFLLVPASYVETDTVLTYRDGTLSLTDGEDASIRVALSDIADGTGLVFGLYSPPVLFSPRRSYINSTGRTSYVLGSVVVSVHFSGELSRTSLDTPVLITLPKSDLASESGTKTECSFWDQNLDNGYGAWSTIGCRLVSEDDSSAQCECNHLTQFALIVDLTPVPTTTAPPVTPTVEEEDDDDSIGAGSYVGGLVCIIFLILVVCTYISTSELRSSVMGVTLINSSLCLCALFISYLISYYTTDSDWACTVFSAIFHYLFLVASLSLLILALLKTMQPERLTIIFSALLAVQFVVPLIVVIISAAPDQDNYINDEFCRPQQGPYWYGLLLLGGLIHLVAWCCHLFSLYLIHARREKLTAGSWFEEWLGIAFTLLLFELAWGFGLPSTNSLGLGTARLVFQILFVIGSAALGLVMLIFFVFLIRETREVWTGFINKCIPGRTGGFYTNHADIAENMYVTDRGRDEAVGMTELRSKAPPRDNGDESAAKRGTGAVGMSEKWEDPEHIVNPMTSEHDDEDDLVGSESAEMKIDFGMFDDDTTDAAKDTKL